MSAEDQIRQFAERIVRLEEERKALANDIKDVKAEAKAAGFSPKLIATCVRIMLMEAEKRAEALSGHEELDLYLSAVGLVAPRASDRSEEVSPGADAAAQRHARVIPQATDAAQGRATPATARVSDVVRGDVLEEPALREVVRPQGRDPASHRIRPSSAGSSAEVFWTGAIPIEPQSLRNAQAGHAREIGGSVWAPHSAARS